MQNQNATHYSQESGINGVDLCEGKDPDLDSECCVFWTIEVENQDLLELGGIEPSVLVS